MKFNPLVPELTVSSIKESLRFYTETLPFIVEYERTESSFAFISYQGSQFMLEETNGNWDTAPLEHPFGRGINFQIEVQELSPLLTALKTACHPLFKEPEEHWYRQNDELLGCLEFLVQDPDGYLLRFSQDIGEKKAHG